MQYCRYTDIGLSVFVDGRIYLQTHAINPTHQHFQDLNHIGLHLHRFPNQHSIARTPKFKAYKPRHAHTTISIPPSIASVLTNPRPTSSARPRPHPHPLPSPSTHSRQTPFTPTCRHHHLRRRLYPRVFSRAIISFPKPRGQRGSSRPDYDGLRGGGHGRGRGRGRGRNPRLD